ncbi:MAG: chaperone NapD [Cocleimonas sp.]|nr:chaperone NapD [Cocleimonas sp.]
MTICSLVIQAIPEHLTRVSQSLVAMEGVEIHAQTDEGKMIISIDHPSRSYCGNTMTEMTRLNGVMSASLVYEYQEDLDPTKTENFTETTPMPTHLDGDMK